LTTTSTEEFGMNNASKAIFTTLIATIFVACAA
jgi:hypothetical protein